MQYRSYALDGSTAGQKMANRLFVGSITWMEYASSGCTIAVSIPTSKTRAQDVISYINYVRQTQLNLTFNPAGYVDGSLPHQKLLEDVVCSGIEVLNPAGDFKIIVSGWFLTHD